MDTVVMWRTNHPNLSLAAIVVGAAVVFFMTMWYVWTAQQTILDPLRSTHSPLRARDKNKRKLSFQFFLWCFFTWLALSLASTSGLWYLNRAWILQSFPTPEARPWEALVIIFVGIPAIVFGLVTFFLVRWSWIRPVRLFCPHCGKYIPSNTPWTCGRCNSENHPELPTFDLFFTGRSCCSRSYLNACKECDAEPLAFRCYHCQQMIVLKGIAGKISAEELERHCAQKPQTTAPPPVVVAESQDTVRQRRVIEKEDLEHRITVAELETSLAQRVAALTAVRTRDEKRELSAKERLEQSFIKQREETLAVHDVAQKARSKAKQKYAKDPEMLELENAVIEDFVNKHGLD